VQERIADELQRLATVFGNAGDAMSGYWEEPIAANRASVAESDLHAGLTFVGMLEGNLVESPANFFRGMDGK
jgi:hypothetical protein